MNANNKHEQELDFHQDIAEIINCTKQNTLHIYSAYFNLTSNCGMFNHYQDEIETSFFTEKIISENVKPIDFFNNLNREINALSVDDKENLLEKVKEFENENYNLSKYYNNFVMLQL